VWCGGVLAGGKRRPGLHAEGLAAERAGRATDGTAQHRDVLSAHNIPWKYYGGGFNADGTSSPFNGSYCNICNPFEYQSNYPSVVADHMRDITDLFTILPMARFRRSPTEAGRHHGRTPGIVQWGLFEAFAKNIIELAPEQPGAGPRPRFSSRWTKAAGITTRIHQPVDSSAPAGIPMIAVSPFSTAGTSATCTTNILVRGSSSHATGGSAAR